MRGFRARLSQELKSLLATPKYANLKISTFKLFQPPAQLNYVSWLGGYTFSTHAVFEGTRSLNFPLFRWSHFWRNGRCGHEVFGKGTVPQRSCSTRLGKSKVQMIKFLRYNCL